MTCETTGTVISVAKQWWFKINPKPVRVVGTDGARYPHIIKVRYKVNGADYTKRKWISAGAFVPPAGSVVTVIYDENKPSKAKIE